MDLECVRRHLSDDVFHQVRQRAVLRLTIAQYGKELGGVGNAKAHIKHVLEKRSQPCLDARRIPGEASFNDLLRVRFRLLMVQQDRRVKLQDHRRKKWKELYQLVLA